MAQRLAFVFGLRPGVIEEYRRRHDAIWPEMLELLNEVGISDYSIYAYGDLLVGVLKCSRPWPEIQSDLAMSTIQRRWDESMSELIEWQMDSRGHFHELDEVFRFEGGG